LAPTPVADQEIEDEDLEASGKSLEDRAEDGEHTEEEDDGQFRISGTGSGLTLAVGGRKPDVSEAKLSAISLHLKGEFKKGDRVRLYVDAVVADVKVKDEYKSGEIQRTRRVHTFIPLGIEPVPSTAD
jgi:hypothetical protein